MPDTIAWAEKFIGWIVGLLAAAWLTIVALLKYSYSGDKASSEASTELKIAHLESTVTAQIAALEESLLLRLSHQDKNLAAHDRSLLGIHARLDGLGDGGLRRSRSPPRLTRQHRRYTKITEEDPDPSDEV